MYSYLYTWKPIKTSGGNDFGVCKRVGRCIHETGSEAISEIIIEEPRTIAWGNQQ